jgi:DNA-directed RNA polymerase specialized sigma24 family protein
LAIRAFRIEDFADFYSARFGGALRTAYALCGDWVEAEELAQGSFVRLYPKWPRVASGNADGYLRTTLVRLFLDARRRGRAKERLVAETPERLDHSRDLARVDEQQSLLAALQDVPPRQRATLVLRIVHDLPVAQVLDRHRQKSTVTRDTGVAGGVPRRRHSGACEMWDEDDPGTALRA